MTIGADIWLLRATQAVALNGAENFDGTSATSRKVGTELDVKVNWQLYDNLAWNWTLGWFKPGSAYDQMIAVAPGVITSAGADDCKGIQGVLAFKF